jgi:hypothetical protein
MKFVGCLLRARQHCFCRRCCRVASLYAFALPLGLSGDAARHRDTLDRRCVAHLRRSWSVWEMREYDRTLDAKWADSMLKLVTFDSVEDFWEAWFHIPSVG